MPLLTDPLADLRRRMNPLVPQTPQLSEEQEQSLLDSIKGRAFGGFAAVGNTLDLPGSMVRDIFSGENPLDQLVHPFSAENRTTGRDMLRRLGLAGPQDTYGNWWAGFGLETLLDPLTYMTFGGSALSKAGQLAKKAGVFEDLARFGGASALDLSQKAVRRGTTLKQVMQHAPELIPKLEELAGGAANLSKVADQRLAGHVGIGLPFSEPAKVFGKPGGLLDSALGYAKSTALSPFTALTHIPKVGPHLAKLPGAFDANVVRPLHALLDRSVQGTMTKEAQEQLARPFTSASDALRSETRGEIGRQLQRLHEAGWDEKSDEFWSIMEGFDQPPENLAPVFSELRKSLDEVLKTHQDRGLPTKELLDVRPKLDASGNPVRDPETGEWEYEEIAKYAPRFKTNVAGKRGSAKIFSGIDPSQEAREDIFRGITGGTKKLRELFMDDSVRQAARSGVKPEDVARLIETKYGNDIPDWFFEFQGGGMNPLEGRRAKLAEYIKNTPDEILDQGVFGNHPIVDIQKRLLVGRERAEAVDRVAQFLGKHAKDIPGDPQGYTTVRDIFKNLKLTSGDGTGPGALAHTLGYANFSGKPNEFLNFKVPEEVAKDITKFFDSFTNPASANKLAELADSITNLTKAFQTSPWFSFLNRNLGSGQFQNLSMGLFSPNSLSGAKETLRGGVIRGAEHFPEIKRILTQEGRPLNSKEATDVIRRLAYADEMLGPYGTKGSDVTGAVASAQPRDVADLMAEFPGKNPFSFKDALGKYLFQGKGVTKNPLDVRGVGGRLETTFGPVSGGHDLNHFVEGLNRLTPYIEGLRQGLDRRYLVNKINAAHINYSNRYYTPFYRRYISRLFPFAKFTTGQIPYTLREILERPGGITAQTVKATNRARNPKAYTPDYVSETASIPLEFGAPEGNQRYLTGFGLALEDPLSFVGGTGGLEVLSRMNPLVKAPLEYITQQSFFEKGPEGGRPLEDLDPLVGRTLANIAETFGGQHTPRAEPILGAPALEHLIANSPASKAIGVARTLFDPRKHESPAAALALGTNLLTGLRISDISPAAQEAIAREHIQQLLKDNEATRIFERAYVPTEELAAMPLEERQKVQSYLTALKVLANRAKERAAQATAY